MKRLIPLFFILCFVSMGFAQNLFPGRGKVFEDDVVPRIDILIPEDSLTELFAPGNEESNYHWHATFIFDNEEDRDTIYNIGFRFRGNTSRLSEKKSFKISFNTYEPGRKYAGLEKLNLNGEQNDPSVIRSKVSWDLLKKLKVPAPRSNHIALYINDRYYGLYINVEHIDEEFVDRRFGNQNGNLYKCSYPADLVYKGQNPEAYKVVESGRRVYELQTNETEDDYSDLVTFINVLNNTPISDLPCELEKVFNVDTYLRAIVYDIFAANWDGPIFNKNNFYLYHNTETGRFEYIPFDLDNTFGIDWSIDDLASRNVYQWAPSSEPRPLYDRILSVPEYKDRFTYYFQQFLLDDGSVEKLEPKIDATKELIAPYAAGDNFRTLDYGFSFEDFLKSYEEALSAAHVRYGLKPFIIERRASATEQLEDVNIIPLVREVDLQYPDPQGNIYVAVEVEDDQTGGSVKFCYQLDDFERLECIELFDDGLNGDEEAGDGVFGGVVIPYQIALELTYYLEVKDQSGQDRRFPRCADNVMNLLRNDYKLYINEMMADNDSTIMDDAGEYDDWIELYNAGTEEVWLGDKYISDKSDFPNKWAFPDTVIAPGAYMILWADEDGSQGPLHINFKLSKGGEFVGIFDSETKGFPLIDGVSFGEQKSDTTFGRIPNGTGDFQFMLPTPGASNQSLVNIEDKPDNLLGFRLYPNPSYGEINLRWQTGIYSELTVEMYNLMGAKVAEQPLPEGLDNYSWKTTGLKEGMYIIQFVSQGRPLLHYKVWIRN